MTETLSPDLLGTAQTLASPRVPVARPGEPVDDLLARMRGQTYDSAAVVAVCEGERLVGLATIERLLASPAGARVGEVMDRQPPTVAPGTDQEHAAWTAVHRDEPGLAVVDGAGRLVGLIAPQRLLGVLLEEHDEDLARIGGYRRSTTAARTASTESVARRLWHRMPWLLLGMAAALGAAGIVGVFEQQLQRELLLVLFLPGVVYIADAVGMQSVTLLVRGLSVGVSIRRVLLREALTGLIAGALLAAVAGPAILLLWGSPEVAATVAVAVFAASSVACLVAMGLPWLISRLGRDPAYGSGPLGTVVQDLLSIVIYFLAATLIVT